jgi:hypothetical protein
MTELSIIVGNQFEFTARLEEEDAPRTCQAFLALLPFKNNLIHARWSGEATWIPLGDFNLGLDYENHTSHPSAGQLLLYPGGFSETEILFPYGSALFASKMGQLAGNHFLTIIKGNEQFKALGKQILWEGAQEILFTRI